MNLRHEKIVLTGIQGRSSCIPVFTISAFYFLILHAIIKHKIVKAGEYPMISEEKVKIMTEMAKYEKNYGHMDFHVNRFKKKDYIRLETIKMSVSLVLAFLILTAVICISQMDQVIMNLKEGKIFLAAAGLIILYVIIYIIYFQLTKKKASRCYDEVQTRIKIYDKLLEEMQELYEAKENEDVSPTIVPEEEEDGKIINI